MTDRISRRTFLQGTAVATGVTVLADPFSSRSYAQNAKVRYANFGVGGRGGAHVGPAASQNLVAACDCNENTANDVAKKHNAKAYTDWRKVFDEMMKDFDAVFVATPDHSHFPIAYTAVKNGKHCYCEKPLTHGVWEARALATLVKEKKVATQMGNQGHANGEIRKIVTWVQGGVIGDIKEVHTWTNRPVWPQGLDRPKDTPACPANLNWEAFIGVAPMRPYHPCYQPFAWRGWKDYGCGAVGDMGCHTWDCVWWSMGAEYPTAAELLKIENRKPETFPSKMIGRLEFPKNAKRGPFTATWYEGGLKPEIPEGLKAAGKDKIGGSGSIFIGSKGWIVTEGDYSENPQIWPKDLSEQNKNMKVEIPGSPGHHEEYIMACRGDKPWDFPKSNFMYGGPLVEAMNLVNVAMWLDKKITWDPVKMKCPGTPEADALIKREYRPGWVKI
jgi:predicted dehydrogenase